jgi:hypothetical protein
MWLGIIALLDKVFGILGQLTGFWIKRSDESKKKREEAQIEMADAEFHGDFDAWKRARHKRDSA